MDSSGRQRGAVLIVALIMLLLVTVVGLAGIQDSQLQEAMAGNMRDRNLAFQVAEAGLRAGENELRKATITAPVSNPLARPGDPCFWWSCGAGAAVFNWGTSPAVTAQLNLDIENPQYVIEILPALPAATTGNSAKFGEDTLSRVYRVTSRSGGGTGDSVVVLQSTFKR